MTPRPLPRSTDSCVPRHRSFVVALLLLGVIACTATAPDVTAPPSAVPDVSAANNKPLYVLMTTRIVTSLSRMESLTFDLHRTALDLDHERARKAARIAKAAGELQRASEQVLAMPPPMPLIEAQHSQFMALARQLRDQAGELATLAQTQRYDALREAEARLQQTCTTCHALFREE